jgi:catechol 2,3-dioxygenase-like lactoylglutathione lyase family enzyme
MTIDVLFAGVAVDDFDAARRWYRDLFGRDPDVVAHDTEVMWMAVRAGWVYVVRDPDRAGRGLTTLSVDDLNQAVAELAARGLEAGPIEPVGDAGHKAILIDPDGNTVSLIEVHGPKE